MSACVRGLQLLAVLALAGAAAAEELEDMVAGLSNEDFRARETATAELIRRGQADQAAIQALCLKHLLQNPDPEIRLRCEQVLRGIMANSYGFLGVRYGPTTYFDEDGKTRRGVTISMVLAGQPAQLAGLRVGDTVIEFSGKPLDGDDPVEIFGRGIRLLGAGRTTTLKIDRAGELMVLPITTGSPPKELEEGMTMNSEARFQEWLKAQIDARKPAP